MITLEDYFGIYVRHPDIRDEHRQAAKELLSRVNGLIEEAVLEGGYLVMPRFDNGSLVHGDRNGGWRPFNCPFGSIHSAHKEGKAVDVVDRDGVLDTWLFNNPDVLDRYDMCIEHPASTRGWCHLTTRVPSSGSRVLFV
jgi:hypothetical protein